MNCTRVNQNGAFNYSRRTTTRPEGNELTELLRSRIEDGFVASAYWGNTGEVPPRDPDDRAPDDTFRFTREINRKLVPFPKEQTSLPRTLDYTVVGLHLVTNQSNGDNGGMNANQLAQLRDGDADLVEGPNGLRVKPRFLNTTSSAQRMPGKFSDDVLKVLKDGQDKEDELRRKLVELKGEPFRGGDPDPYRPTSDDYCDMSTVDPSSYRVYELDPKVPNGRLDVYRSRYNNVEREGPKRRENTFKRLQRGRNVDLSSLRHTLAESSKATMPRGYEAYSTKDWMSTTHREHAAYDVDAAAKANERNATLPLRNVNYTLTEEHKNSLRANDERMASRYDGDFATEYGDNFLDRFAQAEINKDYAGRSVFDIQNGMYTMDHHYHHPRADVDTNESYSPTELVPGQHKSMYTEPLHAKNALEYRE